MLSFSALSVFAQTACSSGAVAPNNVYVLENQNTSPATPYAVVLLSADCTLKRLDANGFGTWTQMPGNTTIIIDTIAGTTITSVTMKFYTSSLPANVFGFPAIPTKSQDFVTGAVTKGAIDPYTISGGPAFQLTQF